MVVMKVKEPSLPQPSGKGCQPHTERQASQWAFYDTIMAMWPFDKPKLSPSVIERFCRELTGRPQGIPLLIWQQAIERTREMSNLKHPIGFLRCELLKRMGQQR